MIVSGARRQENRWDPTENGQIVPEDKEVQKKMFDDAMFKLEHGEGDKNVLAQSAPRINRLVARNRCTWQDDFSANQALRQRFRVTYSIFNSLLRADTESRFAHCFDYS